MTRISALQASTLSRQGRCWTNCDEQVDASDHRQLIYSHDRARHAENHNFPTISRAIAVASLDFIDESVAHFVRQGAEADPYALAEAAPGTHGGRRGASRTRRIAEVAGAHPRRSGQAGSDARVHHDRRASRTPSTTSDRGFVCTAPPAVSRSSPRRQVD